MLTQSHKELVEERATSIMCSADVASALTMAGVLDYTPALNANLNVDDTGNTFAGTLKVSIVSTSTLILLTDLLTLLVTSTTLLVIRVLHLMTLVCSTALTFLSRWFVPLERTPSSPKLASRLVMVLFATHSQKEPLRVLDASASTATATISALLSRTSCDPFHIFIWRVLRTLFFYV